VAPAPQANPGQYTKAALHQNVASFLSCMSFGVGPGERPIGAPDHPVHTPGGLWGRFWRPSNPGCWLCLFLVLSGYL
jgi:hypothetical protein